MAAVQQAGLALNSWVLLANLASNIESSTRQKTSQLAKIFDIGEPYGHDRVRNFER